MVKEPLENVVLFSKVRRSPFGIQRPMPLSHALFQLCCPKEDPKALLEEALDKPPVSQSKNAISILF